MAKEPPAAVVGGAPKNKPGTHGGINPAGGSADSSYTPEGSSGNPGLAFPWEGSDATDKPGELPPLTHL